MSATLQHELEVADDHATLYLFGVLRASDETALERMCNALPTRVRTLRLDMHGLSNMEENAMDSVRGLLRYWRTSRGGSFRLSVATERIVATYSEGSFLDDGPYPPRPRVAAPEANPARTAAFL